MTENSRQRFVIFHQEKELLSVKKDIYLLHRHLGLVKDQIKREYERIEQMRLSKLEEREDKQLEKIFSHYDKINIEEQELWVKNGIPQIVINPFVVSVWSLYESVIKDFANILRKKNSVEKGISDVNGRYFVERAENYFKKILNHPFHLTKELDKYLRLVGDIRNSIVHHYGKISSLRPKLQVMITKEEIDGISTTEKDGKLVLTTVFAERAFEVVRNHLLTLLNYYQNI